MFPLVRSRSRFRFFGAASTLNFNFVDGSPFPGQITFTRASSATYFDSAGVLQSAAIDAPRLDFNPSTLAAQGLLIEEQRTNSALNSGDALSGATGGVVVADQITAPDGSLADFFREDTSNGEHYAGDRTPSVTAGTTYTWSFYAKLGLTGEARRVCVRTGVQGAGSVVFDLETSSSTVIAPVVSSGISSAENGWFRCWIVYTATGTGAAVFRQQLAKDANTVYTGDGTSGLFFWGAQLEVGAFPTSYIPTTTTALTRSADVASVNTLTPWFNSAESTIFVSATGLSASTYRPLTQFDDGTTNNRLYVDSNSGPIRAVSTVSGSNQCLITLGSITANTMFKVAAAYKLNDCAASLNAGAVGTDTTATMPTVDRLRLGFDGGNFWNGWIQRLTYYPRRLANAELQSITA